MQYGIIILAAGASSRLGRPKQLLQINGESLLRTIVATATQTKADPILVILGANKEAIFEDLDNKNCQLIPNKDWNEGIASSIRTGVQALSEQKPDIDGTLLVVCDQPAITAALLDELILTHEQTGLPIIASAYDNSLGTPAFFDKVIFDELMDLKGDTGAKKIILKVPARVAHVPFPDGSFDIDTEEDLNKLVRRDR